MVVTITNRSRQTIPIQLRPPGGDFYLHEQQIQIPAGKHATVAKSHVNEAQLTNLKARGIIAVQESEG